jgi:hypothetical protein
MWDAAAASGSPVHFHTIGSGIRRDFIKLAPKVALAARAAGITSFQMYMSEVLLSVIFSGVLDHHPGIRLVIGEAGTGWIPYILQRMDAGWEDQFKELDLKMPPSEYGRRQCYATYQSDPIGVKLIDEPGEDNIMWGSDFPHPDGVWPDSQDSQPSIHKPVKLGGVVADDLLARRIGQVSQFALDEDRPCPNRAISLLLICDHSPAEAERMRRLVQRVGVAIPNGVKRGARRQQIFSRL